MAEWGWLRPSWLAALRPGVWLGCHAVEGACVDTEWHISDTKRETGVIIRYVPCSLPKTVDDGSTGRRCSRCGRERQAWGRGGVRPWGRSPWTMRPRQRLQSKQLLIELRWVSKQLAFAGQLRPRRLNKQPF
jgi:hypothetical protein|eukprot:COSAG01_NODE_1655_length_9606_cov_29.510361_2_plen_132_part_00